MFWTLKVVVINIQSSTSVENSISDELISSLKMLLESWDLGKTLKGTYQNTNTKTKFFFICIINLTWLH